MTTGPLRKMRTRPEQPVAYRLPVGEALIDLQERIGESIYLEFSGRIECSNCGRVTKKSYSQGFCFPCSMSRAEADICIVKPELCHHGGSA